MLDLKEINTVEDIQKFFIWLSNQNLVWHPDTEFKEYYNFDKNIQCFNDKEINHYDTLMEQSFDLCQIKNIDIYEIALNCLFKKLPK